MTDLISAKVPGVGSDVWSQFDSLQTFTFSHSQRKKKKRERFPVLKAKAAIVTASALARGRLFPGSGFNRDKCLSKRRNV